MELLVVISIIAVLIALLLPAVTRARKLAEQIACQSGMRQIGAAVVSYASGHDGWLPSAWLDNVTVEYKGNKKTGWVSWKWLVVTYGNLKADQVNNALKGSQGVWVCPATPTSSNNEYKPKSKIGQTVSHFNPPTSAGGKVWGDINAHRAMNREFADRYNGRQKLSAFRQPARTIMIVEHTWHGASSGLNNVDYSSNADPGGPLVHWHDSGGKAGSNYVMPDGHIDWSIASTMIGPQCRWHDNPHDNIKPHATIVANLHSDAKTVIQE